MDEFIVYKWRDLCTQYTCILLECDPQSGKNARPLFQTESNRTSNEFVRMLRKHKEQTAN